MSIFSKISDLESDKKYYNQQAERCSEELEELYKLATAETEREQKFSDYIKSLKWMNNSQFTLSFNNGRCDDPVYTYKYTGIPKIERGLEIQITPSITLGYYYNNDSSTIILRGYVKSVYEFITNNNGKVILDSIYSSLWNVIRDINE